MAYGIVGMNVASGSLAMFWHCVVNKHNVNFVCRRDAILELGLIQTGIDSPILKIYLVNKMKIFTDHLHNK